MTQPDVLEGQILEQHLRRSRQQRVAEPDRAGLPDTGAIWAASSQKRRHVA